MRYIFIILFSLYSGLAAAQINGISATKMAAFSVDQIPLKTIEFEPTFNYAQSGAFYDGFDLTDSDSITVESSVSWRVTYAATNRLEIGLNSSDSSLGFLNLAFKYILLESDGAFSMSGMGGLGLPMGNRTFSKSNRSFDDLSNYGIGLIGSYQFSPNSSLDVNFQVQEYFRSLDDLTATGYFINADYGLYILDQSIYLIMGAQYQSTGRDGAKETALTLVPGFSIESYENFVFAFQGGKTLYGHNTSDTWGVSLSVTLLFN